MQKNTRVSARWLFSRQDPSNVAAARVRLLVLLLGLVAFIVAPLAGTAESHTHGCNFNVIATLDVGPSPFGVTTSPDGETMWVANSGSLFSNSNKVTVLNAHTFAIESVITVGNFPEDIAFRSDGYQAFVTNSSDATVSVINTTTRTVTQTISLASIPMTFPFGIVVGKNDKKVFVTSASGEFDGSDQNIAVLDIRNPSNVTLADTFQAPGFGGRPAIRPIGNQLLVPVAPTESGPPKLLMINPSSGNIEHEIQLSGSTAFPQDIAVTPNGRFAYISLLDFSGGTGGVWVVNLKTRTTVTVINTGDPLVHGIGITPDGEFVFATNFSSGSNSVSVIDTDTNTIVTTIPAGPQPNEVAVTLNGRRGFITNQNGTSNDITVFCIPHHDDD
jgi:YVTN family beta-propeller protein